ncbi:Uncharacterized protein FKW44_019883 [Caligus rogercresseyi]|uniref:Tetratricopeptide repeat protein 17 n=1 Tax=Caligus rogercresseyi TaxID=217165 RepID=A0A7T8GWK1_CALRO|nr:Uncharacterized protein FKW44_019883 [Caligus rogercresseyi]
MESSLRFRSPVLLLLILLSCFLHPLPTKENQAFQTWRLTSGKIIPGMMMLSDELGEDRSMFEIISSTVQNDDGLWKKTCCDEGLPEEEVLDCGKPVNFTYYDHLNGIHNRQNHPHIPEPNGGKSSKSEHANIDGIERKLKKLKRERPKSVELYNLIGNFWRIKGDTQKSIECFRRALAVSPYNAEVLLNLARVFYNLQLLDDAIFLTRRSLEVQPPDSNAWVQHFQLGEILKAFRSYQEAALHFQHVLELKPGYGPALLALQDMESIPDSSVQFHTGLIILTLVLGVILWIFFSLDMSFEELTGISGAPVAGGPHYPIMGAAIDSRSYKSETKTTTDTAVEAKYI